MPTFEIEEEHSSECKICGIDEAGLGAIAGPVVVASCCFTNRELSEDFLNYIDDSKKLSRKKRDLACEKITTNSCVIFGVSVIDAKMIDEIGLAPAWKMGVVSSVENSGLGGELICLIDGVRSVDIPNCQTRTIIDGDEKSYSIAAASIIAKVTRDRTMFRIHNMYPDYGFDKHVGYGTRSHIDALKRVGPCEYHRKSYAINRAALHEFEHRKHVS
ncbi:MAG: ribonuclease HII [Holosporales bacterium]|nr:ribonuclease HII [Holosporales bacterium]